MNVKKNRENFIEIRFTREFGLKKKLFLCLMQAKKVNESEELEVENLTKKTLYV